MPFDDEEIPEEYRAAYDDAVALSESPELFRAFSELSREPDRFAKAEEGGADLLREYGVEAPESVAVGLFQGKPNPLDWEPFRITMTRCRTVKKLDRTKQPPALVEATICLGISIVPNPVPGGPKG